jgi:hypothetical protein
MRLLSAILALGVDVEDAGSENDREMQPGRGDGVLFDVLFDVLLDVLLGCARARGANERDGAGFEVDEFIV